MNIQDLTDEQVEEIVKIRNSPEYIYHFTHNKKKSIRTRQLWQRIIDKLNLPWSVFDLAEKYKNLIATFRKNILLSRTVGEQNIKWRFWNIMKRNVKFEEGDMYYEILNLDKDKDIITIEAKNLTKYFLPLSENIDLLNVEITKYIERIFVESEAEVTAANCKLLHKLANDVEDIKKLIGLIFKKLDQL